MYICQRPRFTCGPWRTCQEISAVMRFWLCSSERGKVPSNKPPSQHMRRPSAKCFHQLPHRLKTLPLFGPLLTRCKRIATPHLRQRPYFVDLCACKTGKRLAPKGAAAWEVEDGSVAQSGSETCSSSADSWLYEATPEFHVVEPRVKVSASATYSNEGSSAWVLQRLWGSSQKWCYFQLNTFIPNSLSTNEKSWKSPVVWSQSEQLPGACSHLQHPPNSHMCLDSAPAQDYQAP